MPGIVAPDLAAALSAAIADESPTLAGTGFTALADTGLAHLHVSLVGTGVLARIPKQSQVGLAAIENLAHQAACFERAAVSGHAPRLHAVLPPRPGLPRGALLVDHVEGRAASLPRDLPAIARALARIHSVEVPASADRAPLQDAADPLAELHREITVQAEHLDGARLHPETRAVIEGELARLAAARPRAGRPEKRLISFDAHPGNFIVRPDGEAVLVDLEKCRYSYPALDLAHATLYTSTTWEPGPTVALDPAQVAAAYAEWAHAFAGGEADAAWHLPLRRAMWLWSLTWCAKWRVLSSRAAGGGGDGEDWASELSDDALTAHVRDRVDHYLDPATVTRLAAELDALRLAPASSPR